MQQRVQFAHQNVITLLNCIRLSCFVTQLRDGLLRISQTLHHFNTYVAQGEGDETFPLILMKINNNDYFSITPVFFLNMAYVRAI
jgi:hypothetical protein